MDSVIVVEVSLENPSAEPDLAGIPDSQRSEALRRFRIIQPHIEDGVQLKEIARAAHLPLSTAFNWVRLYRSHGLRGLVRKARRDKAKRRMSEKLKQVIEGLALQFPKPSIATVVRRAGLLAAQMGEPLPTYKSVQRVIQDMDPSMLTLAHEGTAGFERDYDLVHRREASAPNAIWQADHSVVDVLVSDNGKPKKPWLTIILDDYSRAVVGYALSLSAPSSLQTSLALRHAIWRKEHPNWQICGIPQVLYTDHGADFTSRHMEQVAADLKIQLVFSIPGKPRGRGKIERFFRSLQQILLPDLPGYSPPGEGVRAKPVLSLAELAARIEAFLVYQHNLVTHTATGHAPQSRWQAGGFLPQMPESIEKLDLLLMTVPQLRRINRDGIRFMGYRYMNAILAAHVGEYVVLRYDPRDIAVIRVYFLGVFLCRAVCQELAGQTVAIKEIVTARQAKRRKLRTIIRERTMLVDSLLEARRGDPNERAGKGEFPPPTAPIPPPPKSKLRRYLSD